MRIGIILVFVLVQLKPTYLTGATITWTGNGDGISWDDKSNWDTGNLPSSSDDVIIPMDSVVLKSGVTSTIKSLKVDGNTAILSLQNGSTLNVNYSVLAAIEVRNGKLYNAGNLYILSPSSEVLELASGMCELHNIGNLTISNCKETAISGAGPIINYAAGNISINQVTGVLNFGISARKFLLNYGKINIIETEDVGIWSTDSLVNYDSISMSKVGGLTVGGICKNESSGVILLSDASGTDAIYSTAAFENFGTISLTTCDNNGLGIVGVSGSSMINHGTLQISNPGDYGIRATGNMTNTGTVEIMGSGSQSMFIDNSSYVHNTAFGNINISNNIAMHGLYNLGDVLNEGNINIRDVQNYGIYNPSITSGFNNLGYIHIEHCTRGLAVNNFGNAFSIKIRNCSSIGIWLIGGLFSNITQGSIDVSQCSVGIEISSPASLSNHTGGHIQIDTSTITPLDILLGGSFDCQGTLDIEQP